MASSVEDKEGSAVFSGLSDFGTINESNEPVESWPPSLAAAAEFVEHCGLPSALHSTNGKILRSNRAWQDRLAACSGGSLGPLLQPAAARVIESRTGTFLYSQVLPSAAAGNEESYWNFSLTPIVDAGEVVGIVNQANEITKAIVNEKRLSFHVQLADRLRGITDPDAMKCEAATLLGEYLSAARVGFVEVDEKADLARVTGEWTRDPEVPKLSGGSVPLSALPTAAIDHLRSGEVLALSDVDNVGRGSSRGDADLGARLGVRAVITVPLVREGALRAMLFVHELNVREWKRSDAAIARDAAERSWAAVERAEAEQRLRASEDHYRHVVELNPQVSWTSTPDGQLNRVSKRWFDWTGTTGLGTSWEEGLHPDDRKRTRDIWSRSVETGEIYDIEHRVGHRDGSYRWARSRAFPRFDGGQKILLWYGTTEDIHERKVAEDHQRLLINELNHRVKNTLATVQAIAFQTLKGDIPVEEGRTRFETRLMALSRAHNLLTDQNWDGAPLRRVVSDATEYLAAEAGRFRIEGDDLWIAPRAALALALALHELSTNAAKYGALSNEAGTVAISWKVQGDSLCFEWKERNGPPVVKPERRGFGSRLVEKGLAADLGGTATLQFQPDGLRCLIDASLEAIQAREERID